MDISSKYNPAEAEDKWYQHWTDKGFFRSVPDEREPFTVLIPPPNVTGVLHMGHMLNNTIQDVLVRKARMEGKNACWVPGTDHASIATEAKVVAKLKAEGIEKSDLTREEFLKHAWEWTEKHGGIIFNQLKKLGASCDWDRSCFTMDEIRSESVIKVFVDLYNKGLIYRGYRMVNWDPEALTTVSDEEVIHKDVDGKLFYLKYKIEGEEEYVTIATTRPETILGDSAVCINPNDERFHHLKGKKVIVPIANRAIPIIEDTYVDIEFGTGCLKVTPAHDVNDKEIGERHNLEIIDILNEDGSLNDLGLHFKGKDRFEVRELIAEELKEIGALEKIEEYKTSVGTSERTGAVIEPRLSEQWFLKMEELSKPALDAVMQNEVKLIPEKFKNTYRHWMENVHDWCISRQLWWGHQIPAYYFGDGKDDMVVAETKESALEMAKEKSGNSDLTLDDLRQDPDALDTWFSSWLWPISVFDGINNPDNEEINYYYSTNDLVTGPDILFFWVARMIIAGYEYRGKRPFENVYLTGIVRDKQRRKMSKSLGNSPDPIELMKQYGADGVRVGMLLTSPAGNDLPFDESQCEQGRNFSNKIWNSMRLIKGWQLDTAIEQPEAARVANEWFSAKLANALEEIEASFGKYRLSEALMATYRHIYDDFCGLYLEMIKPAYQKPIDATTLEQAIGHLESVLKMIHPFMPFLSEEVWSLLRDREDSDCIVVAQWPKVEDYQKSTIEDMDMAMKVITELRTFRKKQNIPNKESIKLMIKENDHISKENDVLISKLCNAELSYVSEKQDGSFTFVTNNNEYYIPLEGTVDIEAEKKKISEELEYTKGFLKSVSKKLSNERFVNNAPEQVVAVERKKQADAEAKIKLLEEQLQNL